MKLQETRKHQLLLLLTALVLTLTINSTQAQAQINGQLEATIPFQFHVGDSKLPAGKYLIQPLDDSDLTVLEIRSADGSTSALFEVQLTQANSTPNKGELTFDKYGNRYFLEKVFDEGHPTGSQAVKSRYEKRVEQAAADSQEHVPARKREQQGMK
jgi:hypothetical protein